ncbi:MAG TPA: YbaB/EbfC family nucleoid-associated protein [Spirochaetota bacterium]|nr:YbaB/EbfC family nucleoid-associated protein [Spirochaetota bacterium]HNT11980.1 YbaB/EbfC family nucleoid-associated protein [Spirochaetota bacterium]
MLKGLGDVGQMIKLQRELKNIQKRLKKSEASGTSHDGAVSVTVNGEYHIVDLSIDQEFAGKADKKTLEKAIANAVNNAVDRIKEHMAEEMQKLTGGMNIPGMGDLLK